MQGETLAVALRAKHAPWAIADFASPLIDRLRISFYSNCFKNGILPIALPQTGRSC